MDMERVVESCRERHVEGARRKLRRRFVWLAAAIVLSLALAGCHHEAEKETEVAITEAQRESMKQMDQVAEQAYQSAKAGDAEEARTRLVQLSILAAKLPYEGVTTLEGIQALSESISGAVHTLNAVTPREHEVLLSIVRARLAVDALNNHKQPMWMDFRPELAKDMQQIAHAAAARDRTAADEALLHWKEHSSLIRSAIIICNGPEAAVELDSMTAFLTNGIEGAKWDELSSGMPQLTAGLDELFRPREGHEPTALPIAPTAEPPHPIIWSIALGSFIVGVLTYVAWRRYKGAQGISKVKRSRDFD